MEDTVVLFCYALQLTITNLQFCYTFILSFSSSSHYVIWSTRTYWAMPSIQMNVSFINNYYLNFMIWNCLEEMKCMQRVERHGLFSSLLCSFSAIKSYLLIFLAEKKRRKAKELVVSRGALRFFISVSAVKRSWCSVLMELLELFLIQVAAAAAAAGSAGTDCWHADNFRLWNTGIDTLLHYELPGSL